MSKKKSSINQIVKSRGSVEQVAGNKTTTTNVSFFIGIFFIVILALGGLTWFLSVGRNENNQVPTLPETAPSSVQDD